MKKPDAMTHGEMIHIIRMHLIGAPIEVARLGSNKWVKREDVSLDFSKYKYRVEGGQKYRPWRFVVEVPIGHNVSRRGEYMLYRLKAVKWYGPRDPIEIILAGGPTTFELVVTPEQLFNEFLMENGTICGAVDNNTKEEFV